MAYSQVVDGLLLALSAGANLTGKLYYIAKLSSGAAVLGAAATDKLIGVITEENVSGSPVTVQFGGIAKVIAGGSISEGDLITSDGNGKAVATTSAGNRIIGIALSGADSGDVFPVLLTPGSV